MARTNFDALMSRYLTNEVTEEEKAKIDAWLKMLEAERTDGYTMTDEEQEILFQKIKSNTRDVKEIQTYIPESLKKQKRTRWTLRIAAGLLILTFAGLIAWKATDNLHTAELAAAGVHKVILNDGTLVWLHGESSVNYMEKPEGRFAELNGEAFFEVTKDPSRPFTISYKEVNVRVLGTSFNLKTGDSVELKVLTGKVNISTSSDSRGKDIVPNEKAIYTSAAGIVKFSLGKEEASQAIANTEYNMDFKDATFKEVAMRMEKKFDVTINLTKEVENCHLTMDITDFSLDNSLEVITTILRVTHQKKGSVISFAGKGCS